jgi:hypothetical protein
MANRRASIYKYVKVCSSWRYARAATGPNGKLKPNIVYVGKTTEFHPEGDYYLRLHTPGDRSRYRRIGPKAADATQASGYEESLMRSKAAGIQIQETPAQAQAKSMAGTLWNWLEDYKLSQRPESYNLMKQTLEEFVKFNRKSLLTDITRVDLLKYKTSLVGRGRSLRTAGNKMLRVNQFLRAVQRSTVVQNVRTRLLCG